MNVAKQKGSTDCGLYAIALLFSLAFGNDPTEYIFDQDALRLHLLKKGSLIVFQLSKTEEGPIRCQYN